MKKLPKITTPTYKGKVPSTGVSFEFKPFLIGEQKILLMALESGDVNQIYLAFRDIINQCVKTPIEKLVKREDGSIDGGLENLPSFDVESIFLQISAKSVGEISRVNLKCSNCEKDTLVGMNLNEVGLKNHKKGVSSEQRIMLTDEVGVHMRFPSMKSLYEDVPEEESEEEKTIKKDPDLIQKTIRASIEYIFDETDVYPIDETSDEDLTEFLNSLSIEQNAKIEEFFEHVPYLAIDTTFTCGHCGHKNEREVKGLKSFF